MPCEFLSSTVMLGGSTARAVLKERPVFGISRRTPRAPRASIVAAVALGVAVAVAVPTSASAIPIIVINPLWGSTELRDCANASLGFASSHTITWAELDTLTSIQCEDKEIESLSPLKYAENLATVQLAGNWIADAAELKDLAHLSYLDLSDNSLSDLPSLTGLTALDKFYLDNNYIFDISPLSGLKSTLSELSLSRNAVKNVSALKSFSSINYLYIDHNQITNIDGLDDVVDNATVFNGRYQAIWAPATTINKSIALPTVKSATGATVTLSVAKKFEDGTKAVPGKLSSNKKSIKWSKVGSGAAQWSSAVPIAGSDTGTFSGYYARDVFKKMTAKTPKITGTAKVGKTLKASAKGWTSGVSKWYEWKSDGKSVKYGQSSKYKLKASDKGHTITVTVTGYKTNYLEVTKKSKATKKVK